MAVDLDIFLERLQQLVVQQGDPCLVTSSEWVDVRDEAALKEVCDSLEAVIAEVAELYSFQYLGLSAIQLRIPKRVFAMRMKGVPTKFFVNPCIVEVAEESERTFEGCLSFFATRGETVRPAWVTLGWYDPVTQEWKNQKFTHYLGRMMLHELDHLDGILYTERMPPDAKTMTLQEYQQHRSQRAK